jgi:hypothetical protein
MISRVSYLPLSCENVGPVGSNPQPADSRTVVLVTRRCASSPAPISAGGESSSWSFVVVWR